MNKQLLIDQWKLMRVNENILQAFEDVPRENFVKENFKEQAYHDHPLPTLRNQSISQPTTIIMMLQSLGVEENDKVLEIGAGVGYQAALLSKIVGENGKVVSVEIIPELVQLARMNIQERGIVNVLIVEADGGKGYLEEAPYDKIIITAACPAVPAPIIEQMKENGVVVAPVGDLHSQTMIKGTKVQNRLELEFLGSFMFVPLRGKYGFSEMEIV